MKTTIGKVTVDTWCDPRSRNWVTYARLGLAEVSNPRTGETSEYTGNRASATAAHADWVAAFAMGSN